jgi:hypothetical protein
MIGYDTMIASLPDDVRGRLRGRPDDVALREFARMTIETRGDVCPQSQFDAAVDAWAALGFPDPVAAPPRCPFCGDRVDGTPMTCGTCDVVFGPSWSTNRDRIVEMCGHGTVPGM